jgi:hypothetical protein
MEKKTRPYNTILTSIGDTFIKGEKPTEEIIDLTKVSDKKLEELGKIYPEAIYEQVWRAMSDEFDN